MKTFPLSAAFLMVVTLFAVSGCAPSKREQELEAQIIALTNQIEELRARVNSATAQRPTGPTTNDVKALDDARQLLEARMAELDLRARKLEEFNETVFGEFREASDKSEVLEQGVNAANTRMDRVEFQFSRQMENVEGRMATMVEENLNRAKEFAELRGEVKRLLDAGNQPPRLIRSVPPEFPYRLRKEGMNGEVELVFVVDEQGNVVEPRVTRSTHQLFTSAAIKSVLQWKYSPALSSGRPTSAYVTQVVSFRLSEL